MALAYLQMLNERQASFRSFEKLFAAVRRLRVGVVRPIHVIITANEACDVSVQVRAYTC